MKNILDVTRRRNKPSIENEVDEELQFHIDMQTFQYQNLGLAPDESREKAEVRFGDVERIKQECIRISQGRTVVTWLLNCVFMFCFTLGLLLRVLVPESHVNRIGDVMMMIGGLGVLLVYAKQAGATVFTSESKPFQLGLKTDSPPPSFDEQGRTPFDRVRADD